MIIAVHLLTLISAFSASLLLAGRGDWLGAAVAFLVMASYAFYIMLEDL